LWAVVRLAGNKDLVVSYAYNKITAYATDEYVVIDTSKTYDWSTAEIVNGIFDFQQTILAFKARETA
jgi:hypothetical protein